MVSPDFYASYPRQHETTCSLQGARCLLQMQPGRIVWDQTLMLKSAIALSKPPTAAVLLVLPIVDADSKVPLPALTSLQQLPHSGICVQFADSFLRFGGLLAAIIPPQARSMAADDKKHAVGLAKPALHHVNAGELSWDHRGGVAGQSRRTARVDALDT